MGEISICSHFFLSRNVKMILSSFRALNENKLNLNLVISVFRKQLVIQLRMFFGL